MQIPKVNAAGLPQIESKNLTILEDQMHQEALACKKMEAYSSQFQDPQLKQHSANLAQHHRTNFNSLFQYLNGHQ